MPYRQIVAGGRWLLLICGLFMAMQTAIAQASASTDISVIWSTDVDGRKPADGLAFSAPAVTGQGVNERIVMGGADARAHIYDMSGKELFRLPLQKNCDSGAVTLASGLVILGDTQGVLYAIDAQVGKIVWKFILSSPVTGIPLAVGADVVVQTTDNTLYRINHQGEKVWSFTSQQGGLSLYLSASPMLHDGHLYALLSNGDAISLDAANGDLVWRKQLLLDTDAALLSELRAPQASPVWLSEFNFEGRHMHDVVLFSFYQGDLFVVDRGDGSVLLTHKRSLKSAPLVDADRLYLAGSDGRFQAIDRLSGDVVWKIKLSDHELIGPVKWHDAFWLLDDAGHVFRVNSEGHAVASLTLHGAFERLPVVTSQGLLLRHSLGGLYLVHE